MRRLARLYSDHIAADVRRERMFLASVVFFLTFAVVRGITHAIRAHVGPFHDVTRGTEHVHHLVWGILLLLVVGYLWLREVGVQGGWPARVTAMLFAVGAALTLDEFALWLTLQDVYWERQGHDSIDAVILFGGVLSTGVWGGPFFRALWRELRGRVSQSDPGSVLRR